MTKTFTLTAIAAVLCLTAVNADAGTRARSGSLTGPRGTTTWGGTRTCAGGSCSSHGFITGPAGATATRQGSTTCANGTCTSGATITGFRGGVYSRSSSTTYTPN